MKKFAKAALCAAGVYIGLDVLTWAAIGYGLYLDSAQKNQTHTHEERKVVIEALFDIAGEGWVNEIKAIKGA